MTVLPNQYDPEERAACRTEATNPAVDAAERAAVGDRLRRLREYLGFTQQQVADHLGLPRPSVTLIESGDRRLVADELVRLCRLYRVSLEAVLFAKPPSGPPSSIDVAGLDPTDVHELTAFADYLRWRREANRGK